MKSNTILLTVIAGLLLVIMVGVFPKPDCESAYGPDINLYEATGEMKMVVVTTACSWGPVYWGERYVARDQTESYFEVAP